MNISSSSKSSRVVMHIDMDCFYAQVERERYPHFRHYPIAVIQNGTLCVTTNYRVRARGLAKMGILTDTTNSNRIWINQHMVYTNIECCLFC